MRVVCYTCITGGYDSLKQPLMQSSGADFVCFTDHLVPSSIWQLRSVPAELSALTNVKKQRVIKACPHRWLQDYDVSVWIDGNIQPCGDIISFV